MALVYVASPYKALGKRKSKKSQLLVASKNA